MRPALTLEPPLDPPVAMVAAITAPVLRARLLHLLKFRVAPLLRTRFDSHHRSPGAAPIHVAG
jgi:hypothetical protein